VMEVEAAMAVAVRVVEAAAEAGRPECEAAALAVAAQEEEATEEELAMALMATVAPVVLMVSLMATTCKVCNPPVETHCTVYCPTSPTQSPTHEPIAQPLSEQHLDHEISNLAPGCGPPDSGQRATRAPAGAGPSHRLRPLMHDRRRVCRESSSSAVAKRSF